MLPRVPPERVAGLENELQPLERNRANVEVERAVLSVATMRRRYLVAGSGQRRLQLFGLTAISGPDPRGSGAGRDLKHACGGYRSISKAAAAVRAMKTWPNTAPEPMRPLSCISEKIARASSVRASSVW